MQKKKIWQNIFLGKEKDWEEDQRCNVGRKAWNPPKYESWKEAKKVAWKIEDMTLGIWLENVDSHTRTLRWMHVNYKYKSRANRQNNVTDR